MLTAEGKVPIDKYCPLNHPNENIDVGIAIAARDRAGEIQYQEYAKLSHVAPQLEREGFPTNVAHCAVECLGKIMRRTCETADIGPTPQGNGIILKN